MRANLVVGVLLVCLAVAFWFGADALPKSSLGGSVGAAGLPKLLAVALGLLSLGLIAETLVVARRRPLVDPAPSEGEPATARHHLRALGMLAIGAGYVAILPTAGYLVSIGLLLFAVGVYSGKRPSPGLLAYALVGAVVCHLVFVDLLNVRMPAGIWPAFPGLGG